MFDLPVEKIKDYIVNQENEQLNKMWKDTPHIDNVSKKTEWYNDIVQNAKKQDIYVGLYQERNKQTRKLKEYLLLCSNQKSLKDLKDNNYKDFPEWQKWNIHQDTGIILTDKVVIDITDINRHNYLAQNTYIMDYINRMGIVKNAFLNNGYDLPDHVTTSVTSSLWELDNMRASKDISYELSKTYNRNYKNAIANYAQMYSTKFKETLTKLPGKNGHYVDENYFKKNHITVCYNTVNKYFWNYMKKQFREGRYPDFICWKPNKSYLKTNNLSEMYDKFIDKCEKNGWEKIPNFWENDTGKEKYYIAFPLFQQHMFYSMMNEYNTQELKSKVPLEQLLPYNKEETPLQYIEILSRNYEEWDAYCKECNVEWALDDGSISGKEIDGINTPIVYKSEDIETVNQIVNAIAKSDREYMPLTNMTEQEMDNRKGKEFLDYVHSIDFDKLKEKYGETDNKPVEEEKDIQKKKSRGMKL